MKVKVYHTLPDLDRKTRFLAGDGGSLSLQSYKAVAIVEVADLEEAFEATNHIRSSWEKGPKVVQMLSSTPVRSTSVGDLLETSEGRFVVSPTGFSQWVEP